MSLSHVPFVVAIAIFTINAIVYDPLYIIGVVLTVALGLGNHFIINKRRIP